MGVTILKQMKILIVEDAETLRNELKEFLINYGYEVEARDDFQQIIKYVTREDIHLILLDINLPVYDGYYICREIRKSSQVPIIMVTSRDNEIDELMSMNLGADDFITKPYNPQILLARIENVLRRTYAHQESSKLQFGALKLDLSNGTISHHHQQEELTKNEIKILHCLMKNKGKIVSREELMEYLWSSDLFIDDNTLSVNITRLFGKKLKASVWKIQLKQGKGWPWVYNGMKVTEYIKERVLFLFIHFIVLLFVALFLWMIHVQGVVIVIVFVCGFAPLLLSYFLEFIKRKNFYDEQKSLKRMQKFLSIKKSSCN